MKNPDISFPWLADGSVGTAGVSLLPARADGDPLCVPGVVLREARFVPAAFHPSGFDQLALNCPDALLGAAPARLAEFLAGRYCAGLAMRALGLGWPQLAIGRQREPCWPHGVCGAISHTRRHGQGRALAVVARHEDGVMALGADQEWLIDAAARAALVQTVLCADERCGDDGQWLTLAFSAKETLFKAMFADCRRYVDFQAASLVEAADGWFCLRLNEDVHPRWPAGLRLWGRYLWEGELLSTLLARPDPAAPVR